MYFLGAPKHKLIMGIPFYGRSFVLKDPNSHKPGQSAKSESEGFAGEFTDSKGYVAYFEVCNLAKSESWIQNKDDTGNVYMHNPENGHWVGYDTPETVERKVSFLLRQFDFSKGKK